MLGFPRTTLSPEGVPISAIRQWRYGLYFQDDWKVTTNLTLNLGLRYDLPGQPHEINGVTRTLRFDLDPKGPVLWPEPGKTADIYFGEYKYFSPRFGFAYRLPKHAVIRGGYGIFYSVSQFDNMNILQLNPPNGGSLTVTNPSLNPIATIPTLFLRNSTRPTLFLTSSQCPRIANVATPIRTPTFSFPRSLLSTIFSK